MFRDKIAGTSGFYEIAVILLNGMRYDAMVSGYWILIPFLGSVVCAVVNLENAVDRLRIIFGVLFVTLSSIIGVLNHGFFREFDNQFNELIFQVFYDDAKAIFTTIGADYHPVRYLIVMGIMIAAGTFILRRFLRITIIPENFTRRHLSSFSRRFAVTVLIVIFMLISLRGSVGRRPFKRRDAGITRDVFLNKTALNYYSALRYAIKGHRKIFQDHGIEFFLPDRDIRKAAQFVFSKNEVYDSLDDYLLKTAKGPKSIPPRHIFIIVGESYNTWPLLDKYESLRLMERLKKIARKGLSVENFIPSSSYTMPSLEATLAGLPDSGIAANYHISSRKPYPFSLGEIFKRLGYRTRVFYGGYSSWQMIGDFCSAQGFEEVYDAAYIDHRISMKAWGVDDASLFDFVLDSVKDNVPSINIILTTNNHPPFDVDVRAKGFPLDEVPDEIAPIWEGNIDLKILGHVWYTDKCIGDFVEEMENRMPLPLFVITGDHYGRRFINSQPTFFEKSTVPLVLYGKEVLEGITMPDSAAGSHIDIIPTLVELTAPEGFHYHAFGNDLLAPHRRYAGIGKGTVITSECIIDMEHGSAFHPLPKSDLPDELPDIKELKRLHNALHGISWWRIKNGPDIRSDSKHEL